jgi:uncharacterized membrane protein (DUF2068 family)
MRRYKAAAIIMIIHGVIKVGGFLSVLPIWIFGIEPIFAVPTLDILIAGVIWGTIRLIGAVGLFKNLTWGLVLSIINCVIAIAMMMTLLPFGIMDGILASVALILMLIQYFGKRRIIE